MDRSLIKTLTFLLCMLLPILAEAESVPVRVQSGNEIAESASPFMIDPLECVPQVNLIESETATRTHNRVDFSQDLVMRGSVSLPSFRRFRVWGNGYLGTGHVSPFQDDYQLDHTMSGAMLGLTFPFQNFCTVSTYYNYNSGKLETAARNHQQDSHLGGLGLYFNAGGVYLTLMANGGSDSYKLAGNGSDYSLDFNGIQASGLVEIGCEMWTKGLFVLKPFTMLQYSWLKHDSYDLVTGKVLDGSKSCKALYSVSGAKVDVNLNGMDFLTVQGRFAWVCQALSDNAPISSYWFSRIPGTVTPAQLFYEGTSSRSGFWGGVGARISCWSKISLALDYDALVNKSETNHLFSAGAVLCW